MRIAVCSDLHLEFGPLSLENKDNADVLVLSGDICVAKDLNDRDDPIPTIKSQQIHTFFQECCERFPHVIYVMGNHEHYHGDFGLTFGKLGYKLSYLSNLHLLDKSWLIMDGVTFIGGTLWTDMNKEDPLTLSFVDRRMNDYQDVRNLTKPFEPMDTVIDHKAMLAVIDDVYKTHFVDSKVVVVGHHAPSKLSTKPAYERDVLMNGAYSSDLSEFILDRPRIKLWTHGHTHNDFDYMIGSTRIVCNPRGYDGYENRADRFELVTVEI